MTKLYIPISTDSNDGVKRGYCCDMLAGLAGRDFVIAEMGDSHADRAMNKMANAFLKTDCNALLLIDCDIRFRRCDIDKMLAHLERGEKAVWGIYPKKDEATEACLCTFDRVPVPNEFDLVKVRRSGRGFMAVEREVFEALKEENGGPALQYHNHGELQWCFFRSGTVTGEWSAMPDGQREWISEDWFFCEDLRIYLGVPTLVDTTIALGHVGSKTYRFGAAQITRMDSNISSWRDIHGYFDFADVYRYLVKKIPNGGSFAEVGCWLGKSLAAFNAFAKEAGKTINLHAVDTFTGEEGNEDQASIIQAHGGSVERVFRDNMKALGLNGELSVHHGSSLFQAASFSDGSLDAVFIDASHEEQDVRRDIAAWLSKVKPGGIIAGHDYDLPGVSVPVCETFQEVQRLGRCWLVNV